MANLTMALPAINLVQNGEDKNLFCGEGRFNIFVGVDGDRYWDKYSDASATWVFAASILIFFMKTGFLFIEVAFVSDDHRATRRVILAKYLDTCSSAIAFYLFGYAFSGGAGNTRFVLGEENDFIEWFFRFTFASNTATILHGTLVGESRKLRMISLFIYAFLISGFIHPFIARLVWSPLGEFSPYRFCNGTLDRHSPNGSFVFLRSFPGPNDDIVFFDFAGSGAVHMLGGFGGLVLALICKYDLRKTDMKKEKLERNHHAEYQVSDSFNPEDPVEISRTGSQHSRRGTSSKSGSRATAGSQASKLEMGTLSEDAQVGGGGTARQPGLSVAYHPADLVVVSGGLTTLNSSYSDSHGSQVEAQTVEAEKDFLEWMYPKDSSGEHMEFAALGVLILWMTFFAFNCGTTESVSGKVHHSILGRIALNMVVSGCFGGIVGILVALFAQLRSRSKYINTNEIANCILSSLVSITGVCPYINAEHAIVVGVGAALFYHLGTHAEYRWDIRDTARVFPVHGMCGMWGLLCVGFLGQPNLIRQTYENLCQCLTIRLPDSIDSTGNLFLYQMAAIAVIALWSVGTCGFVFLVLRFIPMQGFANLIDLVFVDFVDHYITPVLTVIIACKKPGSRRVRTRTAKKTRKAAPVESSAEIVDVEESAEDMFIFEGGMLLTGETEYGTGIMKRTIV